MLPAIAETEAVALLGRAARCFAADPDLEAELRDAVQHATVTSDVRARLVQSWAWLMACRGAHDDAVRTLEQAVERFRGDPRAFALAAAGLAGAYANMSRSVEALAYAHIARREIERSGLPRTRAFALIQEGNALVQLRAWAQLRAVVRRIATLRPQLDDRERRRADRAIRTFDAQHALATGSGHELLDAADLVAEEHSPASGTSFERSWADFLRGAGLTRLRRWEEALPHLAATRDASPLDEALSVSARRLRVECLIRIGDAEAARAEAEDVLGAISAASARLGASVVREETAHLGAALLDARYLSLADRALDMAAAAHVARMIEIAEAFRRLRDLAGIDDDTLAYLRAAREDTERVMLESLGVIARAMERAMGDEGRDVASILAHPDRTKLCAWCAQAQTPAGDWLPLTEFLPEDRAASHGICPRCELAMRERTFGRKSRPGLE